MEVDVDSSLSVSNKTDVLVIGGGPGGSTAAIMLTELGHRVTLLEKAHHPRFHIGESLLPANLPLLERLAHTMRERTDFGDHLSEYRDVEV